MKFSTATLFRRGVAIPGAAFDRRFWQRLTRPGRSCWRGAFVLFGLSLVIACSHPLEIRGEGDILSASGTRDCYLENFQSGAESCSKNLVVGDYRETYHAVPREGWEFVSWENCFDEGSALDQCRLDFDAGTVEKFWGETAAPLVAVFQQLDDSTSSDNNPDSARCDWQRGWAKDVRGGLGGKVIPVTTLEPDGPGSLQAALDTQGPRVIVFEVGGVIDLGAKPLLVRNPYVTVAGQTVDTSPGLPNEELRDCRRLNQCDFVERVGEVSGGAFPHLCV